MSLLQSSFATKQLILNKKQKKMEQRKFKVIEILALQSGTSERGEWKSQEVILVQYP